MDLKILMGSLTTYPQNGGNTSQNSSDGQLDYPQSRQTTERKLMFPKKRNQ